MRKVIQVIVAVLVVAVFGCKEEKTANDTQSKCASVSGYQIVMAESPLDNATTKQVEIRCPGNKFALGGGWSVEDSTNAILEGEATHFQLSYDGKGYLVNAKNNSGFSPTWKLRVRCVCAEVCTTQTEDTTRRQP